MQSKQLAENGLKASSDCGWWTDNVFQTLYFWSGEREREVSNLLIYFSNACSSQDWVGLQQDPEVWSKSSTWPAPSTWAITWCFQGEHVQEAGAESGTVTGSQASWKECMHPKQHLTGNTKSWHWGWHFLFLLPCFFIFVWFPSFFIIVIVIILPCSSIDF